MQKITVTYGSCLTLSMYKIHRPILQLFIYIYLNISFFTLQKYKYLQNLTAPNCLLNKLLLTQTLISINKVRSVGHCSKIMLFAVFNCLCIVYCTECASGTERKGSQVVVSRGKGEVGEGWSKIKPDTFNIHHRLQHVPCSIM